MRLRSALLPGLALATVVALAAPASALTIVTLALDPAQSALAPDVGAPQSLAGAITLRIGTLPLGATNTTFDVIALSASASGGATLALDPDVANPGLGVLTPAGTFLIPTLFVRITDGAATDLAIPDVTGAVAFGPGGASIQSLESSFGIDTGPPAGVVTVGVVAVVPEPASAALLALGLAGLAARAARTEGCR